MTSVMAMDDKLQIERRILEKQNEIMRSALERISNESNDLCEVVADNALKQCDELGEIL